MRHLPARPLAGSVLCAALALGGAAPAAADPDADGGPRGGPHAAAPRGTAPGASNRVSAVRDAAAVLSPVSRLLDAVIEADGNRISGRSARHHVCAVRAAIAQVRARTAADAVPPGRVGTGPVRAVPADAVPSGAVAVHSRPSGAATAAWEGAPATRLRALARLRSATDALARASAAGDRAGVNRYGPLVVREAVAYATAALVADGRPAPDLQGRPRTGPYGR
ncbi:hypothetical protein [Streptomyces sp. TS71-3]|uniref:hypothetical protein n=1 Tax=Streptomyces sp. TS71-3 TaxID=2733862 RepID=UPI001B04EE53|nr:hypothetical protein [Streptomyces sp. TS71-3]GHJ39984.1 hypothetical protein Sm713_55930 [Streptomyces sp. TS71-3]